MLNRRSAGARPVIPLPSWLVTVKLTTGLPWIDTLVIVKLSDDDAVSPATSGAIAVTSGGCAVTGGPPFSFELPPQAASTTAAPAPAPRPSQRRIESFRFIGSHLDG